MFIIGVFKIINKYTNQLIERVFYFGFTSVDKIEYNTDTLCIVQKLSVKMHKNV